MKKTLRDSKPTFAVVTPSYNQAGFISQTIDSVLNQTSSFKLVYWIMDGKSNDGTLKTLRKYSSKLQFVSAKDRGQTDALNKGLAKLRTQLKTQSSEIFFAYINSDDYYLPGAFAAVANAFEQQPTKKWLVGDCLIVNAQGQVIQEPIRLYKKIWRLVLSWPVLLILNPIPQPAVFIRWSAVQTTGDFDANLRYVMDYEYWLRLLHRYGPPILLDQQLAAFRLHQTSKSGSQFQAQFKEEATVAQKATNTQAWLWLHQLHTKLITSIYSIVK